MNLENFKQAIEGQKTIRLTHKMARGDGYQTQVEVSIIRRWKRTNRIHLLLGRSLSARSDKSGWSHWSRAIKSGFISKKPRIPIDTDRVILAAQMYTSSYGICARRQEGIRKGKKDAFFKKKKGAKLKGFY